VVLTHANLLANLEGARQGAGFNEQDVSLSWMPLTHDMGLIGFHLMMMYAGVRQYLMPTDLFVRRALLWMKFASDKRVTLTCSPNFGYRHFLRALGDKTLDGVDLSTRSASSSTAPSRSPWTSPTTSWSAWRPTACAAPRCSRSTASPRRRSR
jgi:acyl-CoA synthetase (AMP-forming)/AMP-acid ligase II